MEVGMAKGGNKVGMSGGRDREGRKSGWGERVGGSGGGGGSRDVGGSLDSGRKTDDTGIGEGEVEVGMEREEEVGMGSGVGESGWGGELSTKLDAVVGAVDKNNEVSKLKEEIERLKRAQCVAGPSTSVSKASTEGETVEKLKQQHMEIQSATKRRFAALEEEIAKLRRLREEVVADVEAWKNEALRPGNKRGSLVIGATPATHAKTRPRTTPVHVTSTQKKVNENLKGVVDRHEMEVNLLKEMRLMELNGARVAEQELERAQEKQKEDELELERLRAEMSRLEMEKKFRCGGTNLKTKLDEVAGCSARKTDKGKKPAGLVLSKRDRILRDEWKNLRNLTKKEVIVICEKEGIKYSKLEITKEEIANMRTERLMEQEQDENGEARAVTIHEVNEDGGEDSGKIEGSESAAF
ncbi:hypothetical protein CBR_g22987 [Chara braunii]|uniref:Uncharacterized protein n=1 Tax=Chara braunii TaxID=69332 RepID=A0A388L394_CHABU|nr:hypothetical protein CBR_g22987 [Chara braunii]|eukprot:GBG76771.1 hypothetical protein CBR_g22987 [Chara braunii]